MINSATAATAAKAILGNAKQIVNAAEQIIRVLVIMVWGLIFIFIEVRNFKNKLYLNDTKATQSVKVSFHCIHVN